MTIRTFPGFLIAAAIPLLLPRITAAADPDPLFAADSALEASISAPFRQIMKERPEEEYVDGTFTFTDEDGTTHNLNVGIRTRGEFRRRRSICPFAPLRINFKKSQLDDTIFDHQDKLKLVTHCRNGSDHYAQAVIAEYLAYRILNIMTDTSFRVRLMHVKYVYTDVRNEVVDAYAFLVEHTDRMAKRLELRELGINKIHVTDLQPEYANLVSVFHYFIGNTDFSPIQAAPGEPCCHNHVLFGGDEPPYWSIPYDFDQSGLVDARHARPNPRFGLHSVRERLYRGRCINGEKLPDTLQLYRSKRGAIEALISDQAELEDKTRKSISSYVASFFDAIDSAEQPEFQLAKECI
jgi:hypothetical protein